MSSNLLIHGTGIQARATANAGKRLTRDGMRQHPGSSVVEHHDMNFFRAFGLRIGLGACDERLISRQSLPGTRAWQQLQKDIRVRKPRYYILDSHYRDMHTRQTSRKADVPFVLNNQDRACFSNTEIHAADSDISCRKAITQSCARGTGELGNVVSGRHSKLLSKQFSNLVLSFVN